MSVKKVIQGMLGGGTSSSSVAAAYNIEDPYFNNVSLLVTSEVEDASWSSVNLLMTGEDLLDHSSSNNALSMTNTVSVNTKYNRYGAGSMYFDGTSKLYNYSTYLIGATVNTFTVEMWVYMTAAPTGTYGQVPSGIALNSTGGTHNLSFGVLPNRKLGLYYYPGTNSYATTVLNLNQWYHIAVSVSNNTIKYFINGVLDATDFPTLTNRSSDAAGFEIGTNSYTTFTGYIDDLRVTNGVARYTANFTPPTVALPGYVTDKSNLNNSFIARGNTAINTTTKKYGNSSIYFDGVNSYITVPHRQDLEFGAGDFTVEWWMNCSAIRTQGIYVKGYHNIQIVMYGASLNVNDSYERVIGYSNSSFVVNVWYHVAVVRQGGILYIYINGTLDNSMACTDVFTGTAPVYIGADNSDGGISGYFSGYIDDLRVTSGIARYTGPFTPPIEALSTTVPTTDPYFNNVTLLLNGDTEDVDPYWSSVSLLLTGDGANTSTTFTDVSVIPNTITVNGNAQISNIKKKFGTSSMLFDGTGDYLTMPSASSLVYQGDFTIECWVYRVSAYAGYDAFYTTNALQAWDANGNSTALVWSCDGFHGFGNPWTTYSSGSSVSTGEWTHMAVTKASGSVRFFKNGVQIHTTFTHSGDIGLSTQTQGIAVFDSYGGATRLFFNGYIDDFRITKGVARYTANFTPPAARLPSLQVYDKSNKVTPLTCYGNARIDSTAVKYNTGSIYFDGTDDRILINATTILTGDFTIEAWIKRSTLSNNRVLAGSGSVGWVGWNNNTTFYVETTTDTGTFTIANTTDTWAHYAVVRSSGVIRVFVNGVMSSQSISNSTGTLTIAQINGQGNGYLFTGYIDDFRVTKGVARYTATFTPPARTLPALLDQNIDPYYDKVCLLLTGDPYNDPFYSNVKLLLNGDDLIDKSPSPITLTTYGSVASITTTRISGSGSISFNGSTDGMSLGSSILLLSDYTVEFWVFRTAGISSYMIITGNGSTGSWVGWITNSTSFLVGSESGDTGTYTVPDTINTWAHYAIVRSNSVTKVYVNGLESVTGGITIPGTGRLSIAQIGYWAAGSYRFTGYLDDVRVTDGTARYTSNFVPPTSLSFNNISDKSQYANTVILTGDTKVDTNVKKYGYGSIYFDGAGDKLQVSRNNINLSSGDFTYESWIYPTTSGSGTFITTGADLSAYYDWFNIWQVGTSIRLYINGTTGGWNIASATDVAGLTVNAWNHIAFVRYGINFYLFINGEQKWTTTSSENLNGTTPYNNIYIGGSASGSVPFTGYMDDIRITKGVARYIANFTPPRRSLPTAGLPTTTTNYVDDVFSTYLYTGNGGTQTITNGINLAKHGGAVWVASRAGQDPAIFSTDTGQDNFLKPARTSAYENAGNGMIYNFDGFTNKANSYIGGSGYNSGNYVAWTFRKAPKFFDIVTYTGGKAIGDTVPHNLGVASFIIITKRVDAIEDWAVNYVNQSGTYPWDHTGATLNSTAISRSPANGTSWATSTTFKPYLLANASNNANATNTSGGTYIAYLFAHDPSPDGLIQCGTFTTNNDLTINLGWEPQFILVKKVNGAGGDWQMLDVSRGWNYGSNYDSAVAKILSANLTTAETALTYAQSWISPYSSGFRIPGPGGDSSTYIYMAIRRSNKPPTNGTQVFMPITYSGTLTGGTSVKTVSITPDFIISKPKNTTTSGFSFYDRVRDINGNWLRGDTTSVEDTRGTSYGIGFDSSNGNILTRHSYENNYDTFNYILYNFKRAPGFFDVVCFTGTGSTPTVYHKLGVVPEMFIIKSRTNDTTVGNDWLTWVTGMKSGDYVNRSTGGNWPMAMALNSNGGMGTYNGWMTVNNTTNIQPSYYTSTGVQYVAYFFASCAGVSKIGSYTGNGGTQTIDCGFAAGARFILIKRTDTTGDWYLWDSARGIVGGNDPHLSLNTTAAEVTTDDSIDPHSSGFTVNQLAATNINVLNASYIFLAIA